MQQYQQSPNFMQPQPQYVTPMQFMTPPVTGNGYKLGNRFNMNYSDGSSSSSYRLGNNTYTNFSDGRSCVNTTIGPSTNTSCQ